jgi:hypothetical protein
MERSGGASGGARAVGPPGRFAALTAAGPLSDWSSGGRAVAAAGFRHHARPDGGDRLRCRDAVVLADDKHPALGTEREGEQKHGDDDAADEEAHADGVRPFEACGVDWMPCRRCRAGDSPRQQHCSGEEGPGEDR